MCAMPVVQVCRGTDACSPPCPELLGQDPGPAVSARKQPVHCSVPYKYSHLLCVLQPEEGWEALVSANRSLQ